MSRARHLAVILLAVAAGLVSTPAAARTDHNLGFWLNLTAQGKVAGRGAWFVELQPRLQDELSRVDQVLARTAVGYEVAKGLTLYQGYAHIFLPVAGTGDPNEDRLFQQISWTIPGLARGELSSRTRIEERWRSDGREMQWRVREMVRFEFPLGGEKSVRALTSSEVFWVLNRVDWRARSGFDQVRTFVGVEIPVGGTSTMEAGYLNQVIDQPGARSTVAHNIALSVFWRW
ncbi:DUF2490 domain-containing protein [Sphingomonas sp.]|jgi:hypothetical protein|uniref:DUF2490 domain-containing protein n=1 Tax=Sphingomonas sp. TaxID=28214 RepID=UPI0035C87B4A